MKAQIVTEKMRLL